MKKQITEIAKHFKKNKLTAAVEVVGYYHDYILGHRQIDVRIASEEQDDDSEFWVFFREFPADANTTDQDMIDFVKNELKRLA